MTNTVDQPDAEREPENVTPKIDVDHEVDRIMRRRHPGYRSLSLGDLVTAPLAAKPAEPEPERRTPLAWPYEVPPPSGFDPGPIEPERRTVSLEVLTPELRHLHAVPADSRIAVVLRLDGQPVGVIASDAPKHDGTPPEALCRLLRVAYEAARSQIEPDLGGELLMPTPDVLAVLAGQSATFWTKPVNVSVANVEVGWQLVGDLDGVQTFETVLDRRYCVGIDGCTDGEDCVVLVVADGRSLAQPGTLIVADPAGGRERVHLLGWLRPQVRIPADQAVAL